MIRFKVLSALLLLAISASPVLAEIKFAIGEPAAESTKSGIGQISGWAVSDVPVVSVEAFIDGVSLGLVPYGGTRQDVSAAFPDFPDSEFSGWSMKWNYALLEPGEHTLTIIITDADGATLSKDAVFTTTAFKSAFIAGPELIDIMNADISATEDGRIIMIGAEVEGELVDIELLWDTPSQQFLIFKTTGEESQPGNQPPTADAGPNQQVDIGEKAVVEGSASDPDGAVVSYSWSQVSGIAVDLVNADTPMVEFMAPEEVGTIRLRLHVVDDAGAQDHDDTVIAVVLPVAEPNQPPVANAGYNFTVDTGETATITGTATDSDGQVISWNWEWVSGMAIALQFTNTNRVQFTAPNSTGSFVLRLTVSDEDGATDSDNVTITVQNPPPPPNEEPTANAGPNQTVQQGEAVTLSGSGSDPDGTIIDWDWEQISGPSVSISGASNQVAGFTAPDSAGSISIRLTVTDDNGDTDTDNVIITVEEDTGSDNTTGETVFSMLAVINDARGQEQDCGGTTYPAQPPFQWSDSLADIARLHSMDMARHGYFSHTSNDGTTMGDRVFPYWSGNRVGENIAASSANHADGYVVDLWLESEGHCKLIMDPNFTHAGIGAGHDSDNGFNMHHFWTLDFGG